MNIFAIYKDQRQIFSLGHIDPLVINIVLGLDEIGLNFINDRFVYLELDSYSINVHISLTNTVFICLGKGRVDMKPLIESYSKSLIYGDENLLNVLLLDNY